MDVRSYLLAEEVKGLRVPSCAHEAKGDCVFQALFTPEDVSKYKTMGNEFYE
jgi:hypothetical protein